MSKWGAAANIEDNGGMKAKEHGLKELTRDQMDAQRKDTSA
jgi:hypothetical protein